METTHVSETSTLYIHTPGNYPKEDNIRFSQHGESLKTKHTNCLSKRKAPSEGDTRGSQFVSPTPLIHCKLFLFHLLPTSSVRDSQTKVTISWLPTTKKKGIRLYQTDKPF
jgi:hypothetical protein